MARAVRSVTVLHIYPTLTLLVLQLGYYMTCSFPGGVFQPRPRQSCKGLIKVVRHLDSLGPPDL